MEHRLPESHGCPNLPERTPLGPASYPGKNPYVLTLPKKEPIDVEPLTMKNGASRKTRLGKIVAFSIILIFLTIALLNAPTLQKTLEKIIGSASTLNESHKYTREELVQYALLLINNDRAEHGLRNVSLSAIDSAQRHAENMLKNGYFSHWDVNGYKPYMRYTLAGGDGAVSENVAYYYSSGMIEHKEAVMKLQWEMMYNDSDSNWGHRDNILNPLHNKVGIGVAYDEHTLYLVQDFEDDYIEWTALNVSQSGYVVMYGTFSGVQRKVHSICLFYDPLPTNLTASQLSKSPYNGAYSMGVFIGVVAPPNYRSTEGITITAQTWVQTGEKFQIRFSLSQAFKLHKNGVYTLCILASNEGNVEYLTTFSVWRNTENT